MVNHTSFDGVWSDFGKSAECHPSFCCCCFADFETAFVASVASTCNEMNDQNHAGFRPSSRLGFLVRAVWETLQVPDLAPKPPAR